MVAYNSKLASTKSRFIVLQNLGNVIHLVYFQTQGDRFDVVKGQFCHRILGRDALIFS